MTDETQLIESAKNEALQRVRDDREGASGDYDVEELLEIIEARLFHPDFDLGELRRELTPNSETLRRFRVLCGAPLKGYDTARRLDAARLLVDEPAVGEPVIARSLGFADAALFSRWFKRWTGETPKARRDTLRPRLTVENEPALPAADWLTVSVWLRAEARALRRREITWLIHVVRARTARPRMP